MSKGLRLKHLRETAGLGQTEAAKRVGISKQTLYKYERDIITNIPSDIIEGLASLYESTPSYIMGWDLPAASSGPAATSSPAAPANSLRKDEQDLLLEYNSLNSEGKKEIMRYLAYARSIDEYKNIARN